MLMNIIHLIALFFYVLAFVEKPSFLVIAASLTLIASIFYRRQYIYPD